MAADEHPGPASAGPMRSADAIRGVPTVDSMATTAPRSRPALRVPAVPRAKLAGTAALGALVLLALFLRTRELGVGFWIDEGLSVGISDRPLGDIPDALRLDGSPPLYYMLLHLWMSVAGTSEEAVRALSLLFALVAVPVAWWGARVLFGTRAAWMAAVLAATSPFLTQYAQEARMYALTVLLSLVASAAFVRTMAFEDDRRPWAIGFAVAFAAMLYTHNWALFFGAACGAVWLFLVARAAAPARRALLVNGAIAFGGALLLYLPWIPITLYQAAHTGAPWAKPPTLLVLLASPGRMLGQYAQEGRMYSLVALLGLIALTCWLQAFTADPPEDGSVRRAPAIGFAVAFAAMLYTHNWALFLGAATGAAWLGLLWRAGPAERRRLLRTALIAYGGALLLYLPWIPNTLYQVAHTGAPWSKSPSLAALASVPVAAPKKIAQLWV